MARIFALACALSAPWCPRAFALDPALDLSQYAHTAWRVREGFLPAGIAAIGQTPDGYLWLGTDLGLHRFDGVRAVPWEPPDGEPLPDQWIRALLGTRDGTLWIGTLRGLVSFKNGKRTDYPELAALSINDLLEGRDGTVWVGAQTVPVGGWVCAVRGGEARCEDQDGRLGAWVGALHEDRGGRVWASSTSGLWRWTPAPAELFAPPAPVGDSFQGLAEGDDGEVLIATRTGLSRLVDGRFEANALPGIQEGLSAARVLRDRDGALWIGTADRGLVHFHQGRPDAFERSDGLSANYVASIFEDREGTIWVGTLEGLDRFRELAVSALMPEQGLSNPRIASVLATRDEGVWLGTAEGLNRWDDGRITVYRERGQGAPQDDSVPSVGVPPLEVVGSGVPSTASSLFEDRRGRVWIGTLDTVGYFDDGRFVSVAGLSAGGPVDSFAEDLSGDIWIAHRTRGLVRLSSDLAIHETPWVELSRQAGLEREDSAVRRAADPQRGGVWPGFRFVGGIAYFADGEIRATYSAANGLADGQVRQIRVDDDGVVWIATEGGLSRLDAGRIATLSSRNGLPCDTVDSMIDDDAGAVWLYASCALVRIARTELDAWAVADEAEQSGIQMTVFGNADGVRASANLGSYTPHAAKSRDGRLWFAGDNGVSVVDPSNLPRNDLPPPVHIEQLVADRKVYDVASAVGPLQLPPFVSDLQIDYTALSLVAPEKMQFRYRLEGRDDEWQEAGTRRQAFYTGLPAGDYRFHVIASNNDGVWNEEGASIEFAIAPTFYQTRWFILLCVAAVIGILSLLYVLRARQLEARIAMLLEERVAERERIARDLHDTFLQSVHGLILKFQAVMTRMPEGAPSRTMLEQALERADQVLAEGRDRVYELRGSAEQQELPEALTDVAAELAPVVPLEFRVTIEGDRRALHPVVREEAYRIGAEALRNAFQHAQARHIDLEIEYSRQGLSLRVVDDGRGFDVTALNEDAPGKHFGLTGLRERARRMRSQLEVSSLPGSGTEVRLRVPAVVAFALDRRAKSSPR